MSIKGFKEIILPLLLHPFSLMNTIRFNFYYFDFREALKLPVLLYNPSIGDLGEMGGVKINGSIRTGMIRLGCTGSRMFSPHRGIYWQVKSGGEVVFNGPCVVGNNSAIIVGKNAKLTFGREVSATAMLNIICSKTVTFGDNVLIGWNNTVQDTNYHRLKKVEGEFILDRDKSIKIGSDTWITSNVTILPGVKLPNYSVVANSAVLTKDFSKDEGYILLAGCPATIVKRGVWLDYHDN